MLEDFFPPWEFLQQDRMTFTLGRQQCIVQVNKPTASWRMILKRLKGKVLEGYEIVNLFVLFCNVDQ